MAIISERHPLSAPDARFPIVCRWYPGAAALAVTVLLVGCQGVRGPLAAQDPFFASPSSAAGHIGLEASVTIETHQDLVALQRLCGASREATVLRENASIFCHQRTTRFFGRRAEAYRRWVEDEVRELPSPGDTASSASE